MNTFDKLCGALAFVLGCVFVVLGVLGLFIGCQANFTLPPIAGVLPAFIGWGIIRAVYLAWNRPGARVGSERAAPTDLPAD
ncbi:MAG TPA: hypothetical protein VKD71_15075 [Gemmataceae bacterium]|nr:hypothetical protein [Gemmataceae bacterium]